MRLERSQNICSLRCVYIQATIRGQCLFLLFLPPSYPLSLSPALSRSLSLSLSLFVLFAVPPCVAAQRNGFQPKWVLISPEHQYGLCVHAVPCQPSPPLTLPH